MTPTVRTFVFLAAAVTAVVAGRAQTPAPQQPTEVITKITGDSGAPPRIAVPDFLVAGGDKDTPEVAKLLAQVLYDLSLIHI